MKNSKYLYLFICCYLCIIANAQKDIFSDEEVIKDKIIYLTFESNELKFFETGKDGYAGRETLEKEHTFALKGSYANVYLKWLNPLKYNTTWKDSTYDDERDKAVKDFLELFKKQFGADITESDKSKEMIALMDASLKASTNKTFTATDLQGGLNDIHLLQLQLELIQTKKVTDAEKETIKKIFGFLKLLDTNKNGNITTEINTSFKNLFITETISAAKDAIALTNRNVTGWETTFSNSKKAITELTSSMNEFKIEGNPILSLLLQKTIDNFIKDVNNDLIEKQKLVDKLKECAKQVEESTKNELSDPSEYCLESEVKISHGKMIEKEITIIEYEYKEDTKEFTKKTVIYSRKIRFKRYDPVVPTVSSGIFYANTTLKGYGVQTDTSGQLLVAEDNINKNNVVTGLFLNLNFNLGSRYIAPVLQLGIDPTKKRPFMMCGAGFCIPVARVALTSGPIWTWNARLKTLKNDQVISSSNEIEKDIEYKFDMEPKGWYLGLQYNF